MRADKLRVGFIYPGKRESLFASNSQNLPSNVFYGAQELSALGNEVLIAQDSDSQPIVQQKLVRFVEAGVWCSTKLPINLRNALGGVERLASSVDVLVASSPTIGMGLAALRYFGRQIPPFIVLSMGLSKWEPRAHPKALRTLARGIATSVDKYVLFGGETDIATTREKFNLDEDKVSFLPFGIDTEYYVSSSNGSDENFILTIGADKSRDFRLAVEACSGLGSRLCVIGPVKRIKEISVGQNNGREDIDLIGMCSMAETRNLIQRARIVIVTTSSNSYFSGQTTIFSAMACGKPVIFTDWGQASEYGLKNMKHCVYTKGADLVDLRLSLQKLLRDEALRRDMGNAARKFAAEELSMKRYGQHLMKVINNVAGR